MAKPLTSSQLTALRTIAACNETICYNPIRERTLLALRDRGLVELKVGETERYYKTRSGGSAGGTAKAHFGRDLGASITPAGRMAIR